jgi:signal transduction histidine kinase
MSSSTSSRLKQLWSVLLLDFRKVRLSWLFGSISVVLVLLAVGGISFSAVRLLRNLADDQGLVRVQYAGAAAREELRKYGEDTFTAARGLAARPTLRRMATSESPDAIGQFLRRSCQSAVADVCALFANGKLVVQSGPELPWKEVVTVASEQGERFMLTSSNFPQPLLGATSIVPDSSDDRSDLRVYVIRMMDDKLATLISERVSMHVRLVNYREFANLPTDEFTQLHSAGLSDGRSAVARIKKSNVFASSFPVFASTGEAVALLETRLPTDELDESVQGLVRRLWITALVLGSLAVLAAVTLARAVTDPVRALTDAATRLGQGDFSTSIPVEGAAEVGALARTMEDMRRNLVDLTGALRRREAEAQAVLNGVIEGVFAVDRDRIITYLNSQAATLFAVSPQDAIGKFCGDVLKPCSTQGSRPCETRCPILQARQTRGAQMVEHIEPAGQRRTTIITSAAPAEGLQVQVIRDETDLEGVRRARDSVLANISHEFRTPLAAQLASIELLRDGLGSMHDDARRDLVMSLERGTHRLTRLIDNLLESVRIESGQLAIRKQTLSLEEVINDAHELVGSLFELRKQTLQIKLPEDLPEIEGDGLRLTQVFVNLLANANKYAPEKSAVRVGASANDSHITVWVDDAGPGVPAGAEGSIFDRFARGAACTDEPEVGGLGLGLWIVKSIVERHGGSVSASRTDQGCTRFSVTLPIAATIS